MDKLAALHIFSVVAEHQSFSRASKILGTDPSTVSKAVQRLEAQLQVQLFQRTTRSIKITPSGQAYLLQVQRTLRQLRECEESLLRENTDVVGTFKVNLPVSYGRLYVQPLMPEFCRRYPELKLELNYDDAYVDIIDGGYDVSVRSGTLQDKRLVAQQLSSMDFVTCAAPDYLKAQGIKRLLDKDFAQVAWVQFRFKQSGRLMPIMRLDNDSIVDVDVEKHIVVDDGESMTELSALGLGFTQCPHFIAKKHLDNGNLVPVYPSFTTPGAGVYVIYAKREYLPVKVRVFVEFLTEKMRAMGETANGTWALELAINGPE